MATVSIRAMPQRSPEYPTPPAGRTSVVSSSGPSRRCQQALEYIRVLYETEESIREGHTEDILRGRRERSLPAEEEFF